MSTKPPGGTRDFLPSEIKRREYVMRVVRDVYERYGFEPLETPAFENIDTLLGKYGEEGNKLIFKILRRGEHESSGAADLALRYDLTVPLARVVAQYQSELPRFFKRYQMQPVWRADRPAKGRFREFYQCDIDAIGTTSPLAEVEQLAAVIEALTKLGFHDFEVRMNHRQILRSLLVNVFASVDQYADILVALDKFDKVGREGVDKELIARGVPEDVRNRLFNWAGAAWDPDRLDWLEGQFPLLDEQGRAAFENLRQIFRLSAQMSADNKLRFQPTLARGLSYYTGAIMEITVPDLAGSLGGGGRYDNLIGMFLGRDIPACGFSLGLERIIFVMTERNMFPAEVARAAVDVMVTIWNHETRHESLSLASTLRAAGLSVELYPEADKLGKQFKYASSRQVPFVVVVGDEERVRAEVKVKDLRTAEQTSVARADLAAYVRARLAATSQPAVGTRELIPNP